MPVNRLLEKTLPILCLCLSLNSWAQGQSQTPQDPPAQVSQTPAQPSTPASDLPAAPERWNLFYQATSIGQYHGTFYSPYSSPFSLQDYPERDVSLTTTLFFAFRPWQGTLFVFDPEIAGGRGFSGVNGLANSSNGELPRVASATPKPYIARLYLSHDFAFGSEKESVESDENQLAGERSVDRYTITAGRFTVTDFFDDNRYSHDPRTQFMGWAVMYNGAWDYPADVRGYTWGIVQELHTRNWSFRYGIAAEPKVANGSQFDRRLFRDHGKTFEEERRY
jgi:high affinity Mn2+ porin